MEKARQWEKIKDLFGKALESEPEQRAAFLRDACGTDDDLRDEVESLLAAHIEAGDGLGALSQNPWLSHFAENIPAPDSVGPYRLIRKLGEGGMGQVWLAEQTEPVRRNVALKLIRSGLFRDGLLQRFNAERQSLAMMDHPSIARVFEAGSTPAGQPYLIMEYVPGLPITEFCDQKKLKIRERLELFIQACEGVQHAHQKAIIHRDLKPANILVMEIDGRPVPRIIDFGLAKAAGPALTEDPMVTQEGTFVGTPGYMSPEQADPGGRDVDTRTDVYSLGVILYVLLSGSLPFDTKKQPLHEVLRQLREEDPPRPSVRFGAAIHEESSVATAARREADPAHLLSALRGDLDSIAMKALEKDLARRYGTPSDLAADIGRYLRNEPVIARPASAGYRLRKYARRQRLGVSAAMAFVFLLAGFAVTQAIQVRRITRERDRADSAMQFMTGMFKVSDPGESRGNTITAREILDRASANIESGTIADPELRAEMMDVMGQVYGNLGLYGRAESLLKNAVDLRTRVLGFRHPRTLTSMDELGWVLNREGHYKEAEPLQRKTIDLRRKSLGPQHPDTLRSMTNLASTLVQEGHYPGAEQLQRQALDLQRRSPGPEHPDTLRSMTNLGNTLYRAGRYKEAEKLQRETLEIQRRVLGGEHPDTLRSASNLANTLVRLGRYADAESLQRETLDQRRRVLGPEHPDTLVTTTDLAVSLKRQGHYPEAEKLERDTLGIQRRVLGPEHPSTLMSMNNLASTLNMQNRYAEAEQLLREALDIQRRTLGAEHPETLRSMVNLASSLRKQGRYAEAEKLGRQALDIRLRVLGPDHQDTALSEYNLAIVEEYVGKSEEALRLLRESVDHGLSTANSLTIEKDPDFKLLHGQPGFDALIAHINERAAGGGKAK